MSFAIRCVAFVSFACALLMQACKS